MTLEAVKAFLLHYDGPPAALMEVCGTHTHEISRWGIASLLSPKIRLVSGPGCPVCVTVASYVDRLVELSKKPDHTVLSFGDMLRVKGSVTSLRDGGVRAEMVYSPFDVLEKAEAQPQMRFVFAAVGFETTAPLYALLLEECVNRGIDNVRLLTSLKVMPPVIDWVCRRGGVDGFIAPGHVSVITGSEIFRPLAHKYGLPFAVTGFSGEAILASLYSLMQNLGRGTVQNLYPSVVTQTGNPKAQALLQHYFEPCDGAWRGMGILPGSALRLRDEYAPFDVGSAELLEDSENPGCRCAEILTGTLRPVDCPLYGQVCTPEHPEGACMVSAEGCCFNWFTHHRT
ncbi:hydrogenase formation protein HypD [Gehongia tenuis]|uniref:Hydrogenase formation protein HypD n=1 Tax=Gehongia tenuis TaxID=2763655 RepID=A0A926D5Y9_9FIRM|nr:hydrogenase formation protein HypD [Gehongia tenuis]MBC8531479.1 hydrogenase formation protein HypD [Gehongia tenuis]